MKPLVLLALLTLLCGCETANLFSRDPNAPKPPADPNRRDWYDRSLGERDGLRGYRVVVEVSDPGCRIEVNGEHVATLTNTLGEIILWGEPDGRFRPRRFANIIANPVHPGQHQQAKYFPAGDDRMIPRRLYFDLKLEPTKATEKIDVKVR